jgi:pyridoxal phosphate enzyme (YggS family)
LLANAAFDANRDPESVKLLAVSKKHELEAILEAARAGQLDFGENYVQEGLEKARSSGRDDIVWHFIGHLQSNKTRVVAECFDWVHTVDKLKIARRLSQQRPGSMTDMNLCIQVNVDDEPSKAGANADEVPAIAAAIAELPRVRLRGLMCLPAIRDGFDAQREPFAKLRELAESISADGIELDTLSMGMTDDYRAAIFEGATIVRIGTAIFGPRT